MPSFSHAAPIRCVRRNFHREGYLTGTCWRKTDHIISGLSLACLFPAGGSVALAAGSSHVACVTALQIPVAPHLGSQLFAGYSSLGSASKRWLLSRLAAETPVRNVIQRTFDQMQASDDCQKASMPAEPPAQPEKSACDTGPLVQYVVVRRDLSTSLNWPLGAVVAQACHAA